MIVRISHQIMISLIVRTELSIDRRCKTIFESEELTNSCPQSHRMAFG